MAGMRCEHCGELLQYRSAIIALIEQAGTVNTMATYEGGETIDAKAKYHPRCYEAAKDADLDLPPMPS